jgi:hypothetical protein
MKIKIIFPLIIVVLILTACGSAPFTFSSEKMLEKGYNTYKTYAFLPTTDTNYTKLVNRQQLVPLLVSGVMAELNDKGMKLDTLNPDCLFTYQLVVNRKYEANATSHTVYNNQPVNIASVPTYNTYSGSGISGSTTMRAGTAPGSQVYYFSSDNRPYTYNGKTTIDTLREGSMVIDMIDAKSKKIIWRSVVQSKQHETNRPDMKQTADYIIPEMLKKLPRK